MLAPILALLLLTGVPAEPAPQDRSAEFDRLVAEARQATSEGRYGDAVGLYERSLEIHPYAATCAYNIACNLALDGYPRDAMDWLFSAVERYWGRHAGDVEYLLTDGDLSELRGLPEFVEVLDGAEQHWILDNASMVEAARRRLTDGRPELALAWLERAVESGWGTGREDAVRLQSPEFEVLRADAALAPRFADVLTRTLGLGEIVAASGSMAPVALEWEHGHRDLLLAVDAHPREPRHLTTGRDRTVRVWDSLTQAELVTLRGHLSTVLNASFGPEGERIVSASRDTTARVWDARSGVSQLVIACGGIVQDARFSPDGARLVTAGLQDRTARVWDARTGEPLAVLRGHEKGVWTAVFDPTGERVLSGGQDGTIRVHASRTGELLDTWRLSGETVRGVTFSPDGGRVLATLYDGSCRLLDPATGALQLEFHGDGRRWLDSAFDPSGEWIASAHEGGAVTVWSAADGRVLRELTGHRDWVMGVAIDASGARAVSAGYDGASLTWDLETGELLQRTRERRYRLFSTRFSADGARLLTISRDEARTWDLRSGTPDGPATDAPRVALRGAAEGRLLWSSPDAHRWGAPGGAALPSLPLADADVDEVFAARDGRRLYSIGVDRRASLWDGAGSKVADLAPHRPPNETTWEEEFQLACFSPDGRFLLTVFHDDANARLWDAAAGTLLFELSGHVGAVQGGAFDGASERVITVGSDGSARLWSVADGKLLLRLPSPGLGTSSAAFDPAGERIATGSYGGRIHLWDAASGRHLGALAGHKRPILDVTFSPDGARLASTSNDETARVWDVGERRLLCTFVLSEPGEWLAITPEHRFAGTPGLVEQASLVLAGEPFPLRCFQSTLADPGAVMRALAGVRAGPANVLRPPSLTILEPVERVYVGGERVVRVRARATDALLGIEQLRVVQDDADLPQERVRAGLRGGPRAREAELDLEFTIPPGADRTRIVLRAENSRGVTSRDEVVELRYEPPTESLYLLAIGVSDYERDDLDLEAPVLDVAGVVAFFESQQGKLFDRVRVRTLVDAQVRASALYEARDKFLIEAQEDDTILVFVAGHGVLSELNEYWFLAPGATPEAPYEGVPRRVLEELVTFGRLHARRRVMFLDTCHAGVQVEGARGTGVGDFLDEGRATDLASSNRGLYILSASASSEFAREQAGNGIFTRALLDGLAGAADGTDGGGNANGYVEIEELLPFVREAVLARSGGRQRPEYSRVEGGGNFPLARVGN